ncbi:hypothetical protein DFH06DRAFT_1143527 [Mycena polygramma]|nr:hypothetical protein DFH06DRAFT_1143527 [Mycena polygramma]
MPPALAAMCPQTRSRSSANFRSRLSRPSPVAQQPRARPSQRGPSAGARGPPSMRWWLLSVRALRWGYFENVLVVADRREQPVQTSYRALLLLTERPPRDIPVFGQGKNRVCIDLVESDEKRRRDARSQSTSRAAFCVLVAVREPWTTSGMALHAAERRVYSSPYSAFTHDGARHRGPVRARRSWAVQRGTSLGEGLERVWARRDLVSSRRAVLLKIDLFVLLSEGERCGATSAGGAPLPERTGIALDRLASPNLKGDKIRKEVARLEIARATAQPSFSRVTARDISPAHEVGQSLSSRNKTVFGHSEDPGYHSVRHFRHGKLWPIAKRPSQRTSRYVDVGIPSVALIGLALIGLKLWDPRWTLLGREVLFCGEFYFTKRQAENLIDDESPAVKRCQTAQSMVELEGAQGIRRPRGAETWASAKEKNQFSSCGGATVCEEVSGIDLEVEGAARAIEHHALLIEMQPFASGGSSSYYRVPRSPRRNATVCWIDVEVEGAARTLRELPVLSTSPATAVFSSYHDQGEPLSHRIATPHLINFVRFHGAFRSFALGRLDYHLS